MNFITSSTIFFLGYVALVQSIYIPEQMQPPHEQGIVEISGVEYWFSYPIKRNWYQAQRYCQLKAMNLADIQNFKEQEQIKGIVRSHFKLPPKQANNWWIGLTDQGSEGTFYWVQNGQEMTFDNFASLNNQPDNGGGHENCVEMREKFNYQWNDESCLTNSFFICKHDPKADAVSALFQRASYS